MDEGGEFYTEEENGSYKYINVLIMNHIHFSDSVHSKNEK